MFYFILFNEYLLRMFVCILSYECDYFSSATTTTATASTILAFLVLPLPLLLLRMVSVIHVISYLTWQFVAITLALHNCDKKILLTCVYEWVRHKPNWDGLNKNTQFTHTNIYTTLYSFSQTLTYIFLVYCIPYVDFRNTNWFIVHD